MTGSDRACRTLTNTRVGMCVDRCPYFGKSALERRAPAGRPSPGFGSLSSTRPSPPLLLFHSFLVSRQIFGITPALTALLLNVSLISFAVQRCPSSSNQRSLSLMARFYFSADCQKEPWVSSRPRCRTGTAPPNGLARVVIQHRLAFFAL